MHLKEKAAVNSRLVKRDHKPFVTESSSEQLVHSYLLQVCLQLATCVDPGCLCWEEILDTLTQTGRIDTISVLSHEFYVSDC